MTPASNTSGPHVVAKGAAVSLALLLAINLFNYIDRYILAAVEPLIRKEFFAEGSQNAKFWMGTLATAFLVTYMLAAPLFGWLADRRHRLGHFHWWQGRWAIIGAGVIIWSLASGGSGLAPAFAVLIACRVLVGVGEAAYGPTAPTIIADLYPVERRGRVLAWFYVAIPVGSALGYAIGGLIASWSSWHMAFLITIPPGVLLGIFCFMQRDPRRGQADAPAAPVEPSRGKRHMLRTLWHTRSFVLNCAAMTCMTFAIGGIAFWMPSYIHESQMPPAGVEQHLISITLAGGPASWIQRFLYAHYPQPNLASINTIFGAITVVAGLTATLMGGWIGDRFRTRIPGAYFLVSGVGMLIGFPLFLTAIFLPFPWAWLPLGASIFFLFLNTGPSNTALANVTHPSMRATAFALNIFVIHALGDAISPPLIGLLSDVTGSMTVGFAIVATMMFVSGVLWIKAARSLDADTAAAPTRET